MLGPQGLGSFSRQVEAFWGSVPGACGGAEVMPNAGPIFNSAIHWNRSVRSLRRTEVDQGD